MKTLDEKQKQEKLAQANLIDPTGVLTKVLTELFKYPEKDWNTKKVKDKVRTLSL